jgi:hypothetical protein
MGIEVVTTYSWHVLVVATLVVVSDNEGKRLKSLLRIRGMFS